MLGGALWMVVRILAAGAVWAPPPARTDKTPQSDRWLDHAGRVAGTGLLLNILLVLAAASFQLWGVFADILLWLFMVAVGLLRLLRKKPILPKNLWISCGIAGSVILLAAMAPIRSEWLAGGWDPGLYVNSAVVIERNGGIRPSEHTIYAQLSSDERQRVSTAEGSYREVFPGVPIRMRDGALPTYFFPLTPVSGAWLHRLGGLELLHRMPLLFAAIGLLTAFSLFCSLGLPRVARWGALAAWFFSPIWWYHQAIPSSELPQLVWLSLAMTFYLDSVDAGRKWPVLVPLALLAGTANRFDFPVFAGLFLVLAAWAEAGAKTPRRGCRTFVCFLALGIGLIFDVYHASDAVWRLQAKDQVLLVVLLPFVLAAVLAGWLLAGRWSEPWISRVQRAAWILGRAAAVGLLAASALAALALWMDPLAKTVAGIPVVGDVWLRYFRIVPFQGAGWCVAVSLGAVGMAGWGHGIPYRWRLATIGLGVALFFLLLHGGIAPIYPWALRRYVVFLVPFMALTMALLVHGAWAAWQAGRRVLSVALVALLAMAFGDGIRNAWPAARVGDYKELGKALHGLAAQIGSTVVVVADDPRWGTPLLMAYGKNVLNGKALWENPDETYRREYMLLLERLNGHAGLRILWLTSTKAGISLYRLVPDDFVSFGRAEDFACRMVVHGSRADHFAVRTDQRSLALHEWRPVASAGRPSD